MTNAYLHSLPLKFLRKMAGFSTIGGDYFLGRAEVEPPIALKVQVFPWLDKWELRFMGRAKNKSYDEGGLDNTDIAGHNFAQLLSRLRVILLQDLAILQPG